jgi:hypothetical protein
MVQPLLKQVNDELSGILGRLSCVQKSYDNRRTTLVKEIYCPSPI